MKILYFFIIMVFLSVNMPYSQDNKDAASDIKVKKEEKIIENKKENNDKEDDSKKTVKKEEKNKVIFKKDNKPSYIFMGKSLLVWDLNNFNKAGIALAVLGITFCVSGTALFIYDYIGFKDIVFGAQTFDEYKNYYIVDITLLATSIFFAAAGSVLFIVSIPLILNTKNKNKTSLFIRSGRDITVGFKIRFN